MNPLETTKPWMLAAALLTLASPARADWERYVFDGFRLQGVETAQDLVRESAEAFSQGDPVLRSLLTVEQADDAFKVGSVRYVLQDELSLGGVAVKTYVAEYRARAGVVDAVALEGEDLDWWMAAIEAYSQADDAGLVRASAELVVEFAARIHHVEAADLCEDLEDVVEGGLLGMGPGAAVAAYRAACRAGEEGPVTERAVDLLVPYMAANVEGRLDVDGDRFHALFHRKARAAVLALSTTDTSLTGNDERADDAFTRLKKAWNAIWVGDVLTARNQAAD